MEMIEKQIENDSKIYVETENGAIGYKSTGNMLVDLNFSIPEMRGMDANAIIDQKLSKYVINAMVGAENPWNSLFLKWLFYVRDIRGGLGERHIFGSIMSYIAENYPEHIEHLIKFIPEYGRWDDLLPLLRTRLKRPVMELMLEQLMEDQRNRVEGKPVSLLAKWMPSLNSHNSENRRLAMKICDEWHWSYKIYRKTLRVLRDYIDIVESKMSRDQWDKIKYEAVPSKANIVYSDAFARHDPERRAEYLSQVESGEKKINASTLFPHEIVHKLIYSHDRAAEVLWKALPNIDVGSNTIVVRDGSGSMTNNYIPKSSIDVLTVATALSIYFAERLRGPYKDKFITFSERPEMVTLNPLDNLYNKIRTCNENRDVANTNIEAVFSLLLTTALSNHVEQKDMIDNILLISDMEFDGHVEDSTGSKDLKPLFERISEQWNNCGYKLPRIIFWNVASRSGAIPMVKSDLGVVLVSGYSINIIKAIMAGKADPWETLKSQLMSERYKQIETLPEYLLSQKSAGVEITPESEEIIQAYFKQMGVKIETNNG